MHDLTGKKFNRLEVVKRNGSSKDKRAVWLCKCDCGNFKNVVGKDIISGKTKSCGCLKYENSINQAEDLTGQKFGRLTVVKRAENSKSNKTRWECICDCGNELITVGAQLKNGRTKSCGCLQKELLSKRVRTHGMTNERLYGIWCGIKQRCFNPNIDAYKNYGGRGITMCDEWFNDFSKFQKWALKNRYSDDLTIERKDVNGNYEPSNCCWTTRKMQSRNRTDSHNITCGGKTMILTDWALYLGVTRGRLAYLLKRSNFSEEETIKRIEKGLIKK